MILSRRLILFFIILLGIVPILAITDPPPPDTIEEVEFLDGIGEMDETSQEPYVINTSAYWTSGPDLTVSVAGDEDVRPEALDFARNFISGNVEGNTTARWNELLTSFPSGHIPTLALAPGQDANIKVVLTDEDHPEGKMGKTRLFAVKGVRHILSAEVVIYSTNRALDQGTLEHVLAHELGHALGLSHSTNPESIMFSLIELQNGSVINHIGSCEERGISLLYVESRIGTADC